MLDLVAYVVLSLAITHATSVIFKEFLVRLVLRVRLIFLATEALVDQVEEDTLREIAKLT
jgi:hypothetical protein